MSGNDSNSALAKALALVPSGCSIITSGSVESGTGMLASWVQQAAFDPPLVTVSIKAGRPIQTHIDATSRFVLNVLGEDPGPMFKHFGAGFEPGAPAFDGLDVAENQWGVQLSGVAGTLSCEVQSQLAASDHIVYLAKVCDSSATEGAKPYVHIRKSGLSY